MDLSASATIGDVINAITTGTGGAVTAQISADGSGLTLTGTGPIAVSDVAGGRDGAQPWV